MDFSWLQSLLYGFLTGITEILPVSAQAHRVLMLKFVGIKGDMVLLDLMIHCAVLGALYYSSQTQLVRFSRALALARVPKRRRKRPLDMRSLMDIRMLRTMLVPVILAYLFYQKAAGLGKNLMVIAGLLFVNGLILYIPQFLPGSNRDSRNLSRVEGLLMGLGGAASVLPGISGVGASVSVGSVCGVERSYCLTMTLLMQMGVMAGLIVYDIIALVSGSVVINFTILLQCLLASLTSFGAAMLGIKLLRYLAADRGFSVFAFYSFGLALFTFLLNLMA